MLVFIAYGCRVFIYLHMDHIDKETKTIKKKVYKLVYGNVIKIKGQPSKELVIFAKKHSMWRE